MKLKRSSLNGRINPRQTTVEENIATAACCHAIAQVRSGRVTIQSVEAAIWLLETGAAWMDELNCSAIADDVRGMARRVIAAAIEQGYETLEVKKINRPGNEHILFLR